eukprot:scaffold16715_cov80-Cyclotella_meneghiniana.AAC.3
MAIGSRENENGTNSLFVAGGKNSKFTIGRDWEVGRLDFFPERYGISRKVKEPITTLTRTSHIKTLSRSAPLKRSLRTIQNGQTVLMYGQY